MPNPLFSDDSTATLRTSAKVYTCGDWYMLSVTLPTPPPSHAPAIAQPPSRAALPPRPSPPCAVQGRQLYLGGYDSEEAAAEAHDLAAIFCKGDRASTNFTHDKYAAHLDEV